MKYNLYALTVVILMPCLQANIVSGTWNKAKTTAQSTYNKAQKDWNELTENTTRAVIAGSSVAGAPAIAARGYNAYASKQTQMHTRPRPSILSEEQQRKTQ